VANATLSMAPAPPVAGYTSSDAFGSLTFTAPVAIVSPPGETNRLFIVEQGGRIIVITNLASPTRTTFFDISARPLGGGEQGLLGLAFHPGYATNRLFFIFYTITISGTLYDRLSRFEISPSNPNQGLTNSEVVLISQPDDFGNHNAGDLHFGPDGYLYVSLGDEGGGDDTGGNSQRIDRDFFSAILRLDVDKRLGSLVPTPHPAIVAPTNYAVPPDNPFVGATQFNDIPLIGNVRTEFWAAGLRNPWRFFIDQVTGLIYCGDVGQGAREEIDIIVKGGNYGWNYREGYIQRPGSGTPPAGFRHVPPILDYSRTPSGASNVGFSVIGGVVYRGSRIPGLNGAYVFGDFGSGNIWAARYDGSVTTNVPFVRLLSDPGVSSFGLDPSNGDVLYADVSGNAIRRLVALEPPGAASNPMPTHMATGVSLNPTLSWTAGSGATSHQVFFGTSPTPGTGDLKSTQSGTSYSPGTLAAASTYYWRIDEVNGQGTNTGPVWSFSTVVSVQTNGISTNGLALWLRADRGVVQSGGLVTQWSDQSSNNRQATQSTGVSQPTLVNGVVNGLPVVRFDGVNDFLMFNLPVNGLSGMSIFLVAANTVSQTVGDSRAERAALFWNETSGWGTLYLTPFQTQVAFRFGTTQPLNWPLLPRPSSLGGGFSISTAIKDGTTDSLYTNGVLAFSEGGKLTTIAGCSGTGNIGRGYNNNTFYAGDIGEVLVYDRALNASERMAVEQYLINKWLQVSPSVPQITQQPADTTVTEPSAATFSVAATGNPSPSYQWRRGGSAIPAATSSTYVLTSTSRTTDNGAQFDVVVTNAVGSVTSVVARLTVLAQPTFSTTGLALWLRADLGVTQTGGAVTQWSDQSPNNRPATQGTVLSQPTLVNGVVNGLPVVRFDGVNDFMTFTLGVNGLSGMSIFLVAANTVSQTGGSSRAERAALFWNETSGWGTLYLTPFQTEVAFRFGTTQPLNWPLFSRPSSLGSSFSISTAIKDGTTDSLYTNGVLAFSEGGKLTTIAGCSGTGNIGRGYNNNTFYAGDIAEVIVYDRALTTSERSDVEFYLKSKYGLLPPAPSPPPSAPTEVDATLGLLSITQDGARVIICWPQTCIGCVLEGSRDLIAPMSWAPVDATVRVIDGRNCSTLPIDTNIRFFRLRQE
jgi:glucose/arabinose dehydrogenase